ncbi:DNA repair protein RAD5B-like [Magnolia sinica]|uniref:DNA repair protein RAD5B-like n=1 Tax=Magnolia sinica TaxID=86752 RepID=UPI00265A4193|nr:DNA repair protein RAD5B-like [Magnolia sinica]
MILVDAMGLRKTVMTIALILGKPVRESPDDQQVEEQNQDFDNKKTKNGQKDPQTKSLPIVKGGTLVVCPMALLGQWKNNLEDLYNLLCFLHVEPWCNWAWWQKLIQKPYESGDERGLRLVKVILRNGGTLCFL